MAKVRQVASEQHSVVSEADASNLEVQSADARQRLSEADEGVGTVNIPREHNPGGEKCHAILQLAVGEDLVVRIGEFANLAEPAAQLFFDCDDRGGSILICPRQPLAQPIRQRPGIAERRDVIGIEHEHGCVLTRRFAAAARLRQGGLLHEK